MLTTYLTVVLVAYLLGSIPFGYILVKLFLKQDIRTTGSGNIGATNVARSGRKGLALATLLLDAGKGYLAVWAAMNWLYPFRRLDIYDPLPFIHYLQTHFEVWGTAALFAILGHVFPVWLKFRGGKGVATAVGAFLLLTPKAVGVAVITFALLFAVSRIVSLASISAAIAFSACLLSWRFTFPWPEEYDYKYTGLLWTAAGIVILKHHSNIRRLLNGTEPKFGEKKVTPTDPIQMERNA
jgi:acyl phosphate:glycerol-3-phosphate acyltransferase